MNTPVIDMHGHVVKHAIWGAHDDPDTYLRILDAAGIDRAPVSSPTYGDVRYCNDTVAKFVALHPDRFMGVAYVRPRDGEKAIDELERAFDELGMIFLKLVPTDNYGFPIDGPGHAPILEWCNNRDIIVKSHTSYNSVPGGDTFSAPWRFIGLAKQYPRIRWILAHSGNGTEGQEQAIEAAQSSRNIYLETCSSWANHGSIERIVSGAGEDRVLFGSDMPLMDARFQLARIVTAKISREAKRKILGLNAIELLGLSA